MQIESILDGLFAFAFYYPLTMAYVWMVGGIYYYFHWERDKPNDHKKPPADEEFPPVSVLIPCFNEAERIEESIDFLFRQEYPEFEVIVINDGSTDNTKEVLEDLSERHPKLRVVNLKHNRGKATALRAGALLSRHEILVTIDSDAVLDEYAITWLVRHFKSPRVAAVTGNPRIRNRSTLLGKIQVGEFSFTIGLIKRAQRIYGRVFTVSGVVTAFRKAALQRIGFWSTDVVTEDIEVSWRLQLDHWDVRFEPKALCWILMPETYAGLWRQRFRWALGGAETAIRHAPRLLNWRARRMWPVFIEYCISVVWSYTLVLVFALWLTYNFVDLPLQLQVPTLLVGWTGVVLGMTCFLQFLVSLTVDSRYERGLLKYFFWTVWYPLAYWMINVLTTVTAVPAAIFKRSGRTGQWKSPDRGRR